MWTEVFACVGMKGTGEEKNEDAMNDQHRERSVKVEKVGKGKRGHTQRNHR